MKNSKIREEPEEEKQNLENFKNMLMNNSPKSSLYDMYF